MTRKFKVTTDNDELYNADKKIKSFVENHGKNLSDDERSELGELLDERARALSNVLGVKVGSITGND
jgi:small-conductance mechanosensitive channel